MNTCFTFQMGKHFCSIWQARYYCHKYRYYSYKGNLTIFNSSFYYSKYFTDTLNLLSFNLISSLTYSIGSCIPFIGIKNTFPTFIIYCTHELKSQDWLTTEILKLLIKMFWDCTHFVVTAMWSMMKTASSIIQVKIQYRYLYSIYRQLKFYIMMKLKNRS